MFSKCHEISNSPLKLEHFKSNVSDRLYTFLINEYVLNSNYMRYHLILSIKNMSGFVQALVGVLQKPT